MASTSYVHYRLDGSVPRLRVWRRRDGESDGGVGLRVEGLLHLWSANALTRVEAAPHGVDLAAALESSAVASRGCRVRAQVFLKLREFKFIIV